MNPRPVLLAALLSALVLVACEDDAVDQDLTGETETATASASPTQPAATETPAATPDPAVAQRLARSPAYLLYEAAGGETLDFVAEAFGGGASADSLRTLNQLGSDDLVEGQLVAVPNPFTDGELLPVTTIGAVLGIGRSGIALRLYRPAEELVDGLLGRVALHRVRLAPPEEGRQPGYVFEYAQTDRPALKGGVADEEARVVGIAFTIGAGSLVEEAAAADRITWELDGVDYAVATLPSGPIPAEPVASMLVAAP